MPMPVQRAGAKPSIRENINKVALQRGPVLYCLEECDNSFQLAALFLPKEAGLVAKRDKELKMPVLAGPALRLAQAKGKLYTTFRSRQNAGGPLFCLGQSTTG